MGNETYKSGVKIIEAGIANRQCSSRVNDRTMLLSTYLPDK